MELMKERPPYVRFETRAVEDRAASIEQGHFVPKDVHYVLVTPAGSKDCVERVADEWFANLAEQVKQGRFPQEWLTAFKGAFSAWKNDQDAPLNGFDIRQWPGATPAQIKRCKDLQVHTVEDLAAANEETLGRLGMGGRALKQKAVEWLASSKDVGQAVEAITAAKAQVEDLTLRNQSLEDQLKQALARLDALERAAPGKKL